MADATGPDDWRSTPPRSPASRISSFTFLYKCAEQLGVDVIELLTGENPHLTGYSLTRAARRACPSSAALASSTCTRRPTSSHKLAEPFLVTAPYLEEEQDVPVHLSRHEGQELDFIISGQMRFAYEDHEEESWKSGRSRSCTTPAAATA